MPKTFTAQQLAAVTADGEYRADRNIYLQVRGPSRSWVFRYRFLGRVRRMGLGSALDYTLTDVRRKATAARKLLDDGIDPLDARRRDRAAHRASVGGPTFEVCAEEYIVSREPGWRDKKRAERWRGSLKTYVFPTIGKLTGPQITTDHVLTILKPVWSVKPETAGRLRGRIENIIEYMVAKKRREPGPNPAAWNGPLGKLLPPLSAVQKVVHHPSVPYADIPALFARIRAVGSLASRALGFTLLTCVRSGEARGARWAEFDLETKTWTIPAERMKMEQPHVVPLTEEALALLPERGKPDALVFPGAKRGEPLSDATMLKVLRTITKDDATVHGLRASFRTWAAEATDARWEIAEACLAHRVGDDVERAYARTTFFEKRKALMEAWATYCQR